MTKALRTGLGTLTAAIVLAAVPPVAAGEGPVVPPENSAVNQYTESFPTAGGEKDAYEHRGGNLSPGAVLGARNAKRLERHGQEGRAVADLAAETAPPVEDQPSPSVEDEPDRATVPGGQGGGDGGAGESGSAQPQSQRNEPVSAVPAAATRVSGSSGPWAVIGEAIGSSSGGTGILLPLLILATILWAFAFLIRQRRPVG